MGLQKYFRQMRYRCQVTAAREEDERAGRKELMRKRGLARKNLVQQATDVLLAIKAQAHYQKMRNRLIDPRVGARGMGGCFAGCMGGSMGGCLGCEWCKGGCMGGYMGGCMGGCMGGYMGGVGCYAWVVSWAVAWVDA